MKKPFNILRAFLRLTGFVALAFFIVLTLIVIKANNFDITFRFFGYEIYTTLGFLLGIFGVVFYFIFKFTIYTLKIRHKINIFYIKKRYKKKVLFGKSKLDYEISSSLRRVGRVSFLKNFEKAMNSSNIRYYNVYTKDFSPRKKLRVAQSLFKRSPNNSIANLIYSSALFENKQYTKCRDVLVDFIERKSILIENTRVMYLMSKLIIDAEKMISQNLDFAYKYLDYIELYEQNVTKNSKRDL